MWERLKKDGPVFLMAALFVGVTFSLMVREHNAFNTRIGDFGRFSQAIWSVLEGKLLYTQIPGRSILGDHFSPIMALAAPLLLIWPNERVLFLVQAVHVGVSGLIIYYIMKAERPNVAPWLALAFFLNPDVYEFTLVEFRRIPFALPWLCLSMLGLTRDNRKLTLIGLLIALMAKEDISVYIAMIGVYLLVIKRDTWWGIGMIVLGASALVLITQYVIPAFSGAESYPQLFYYSHLGASYSDILANALHNPVYFIQTVFGRDQLFALFRVLFSVGFLALLAPEVVLICSPLVLLMFMSSDLDMLRLQDWYMATVVPILFAAIVIGWRRVPKKWDRPLTLWLITASLIGYALFSRAPFGRRYDAQRYVATEHDKAADAITDLIPKNISLLAQTYLTPHLTHVEHLTIFLSEHTDTPFSAERIASVDYLLLDRKEPQPPLGLFETELVVQNFIADLNYTILEEIDGIYHLKKERATSADAYPINRNIEGKMLLNRVEVATTDSNNFFQSVGGEIIARPNQTWRIALYWEALSDGIEERTVSVRLSAADGSLIAQNDSLPAEGIRPTSWWKKGQEIRDIHYFTIPDQVAPQTLSLDIVVYDSFAHNILPFSGDTQILSVAKSRIK